MADPVVTDNPGAERYEIHVEGALAGFAEYRGGGELRAFTHTEIDPEFEGMGLGSILVRAALDDVRERGLVIHPLCPFVRGYVEKHPEYLDLVDPRIRKGLGLV